MFDLRHQKSYFRSKTKNIMNGNDSLDLVLLDAFRTNGLIPNNNSKHFEIDSYTIRWGDLFFFSSLRGRFTRKIKTLRLENLQIIMICIFQAPPESE